MPPKGKQGLSKGRDDYAEHRCVNCRHLRYLGEKRGDLCRVCGCTQHVIPGDLKVPGGDAA